MKKLISAITVISMILSVLCLNATALEVGSIGLELVSVDKTAVVVDLVIHDASELFPKSFGVYVTYPDRTTIENCEFLRDDGTGTTGINMPGIPYQVSWTADGDSIPTDKTAIARLTFTAGADVNETPLVLGLAFDMDNPTIDKNGKDVSGGFKLNGLTVSGRTPGDADNSGKVNLTDVGLILKHIASWDIEMNEANADVTGDGKVNLNDASLILQFIAGWDVVLK